MADSKITALPANTTPVGTDLAVIVDDPAGTPATQKITLSDLQKFILNPTTLNTAPAGSDTIPIIDDPAGTPTAQDVTIYKLQEFVSAKGADVASGATVTLGDGELFHITGTVTITAIAFTNSWVGRRARIIFDGSLTLTHNATSLILPGAQNIQTAPGDSATFVVDNGTNVKCMQYERAAQAQMSNPFNASTAAQSPAANATTYITNSDIAIPASGLRAGSVFYFRASVTKTAAGTAASTVIVKLGTAGGTGDTSLLSFTIPAGTGVADEGYFEIFVTCRGPLGASCIFEGHLYMTHRLATTGLMGQQLLFLQATSSNFNSAQSGLKMGIAFTAGVSVAWTFRQMISESQNV